MGGICTPDRRFSPNGKRASDWPAYPNGSARILHHVLGLEPVLRGAAAVEAGDALGDDPLKPEIDSSLEAHGTIAIDMIAELDWTSQVRLDQLSEGRPAL